MCIHTGATELAPKLLHYTFALLKGDLTSTSFISITAAGVKVLTTHVAILAVGALG